MLKEILHFFPDIGAGRQNEIGHGEFSWVTATGERRDTGGNDERRGDQSFHSFIQSDGPREGNLSMQEIIIGLARRSFT